jgi:ribosome biogenesis GTPase
VYVVALDDGTSVEATLRGRLKRDDGQVVIGDRVSVAPGAHADWRIESVEPRTTQLVRRGRGGRSPKVLAANLDRAFAVVALSDPTSTPERVDRLLAMIEASGMHPVLVLNKVDVPGARAASEFLMGLYERVGYRTLVVSAKGGEGLAPLGEMLCLGASALIGPSGVGKSSILNALDPALRLPTGELSARTGTGRHTTVSSRLIPLACGGLVADTPGFGDVALWGLAPNEVSRCFPDLEEAAEQCRFRSCSHRQEPGCGVREALFEGRVIESRYRSYMRVRDEAVEAAER